MEWAYAIEPFRLIGGPKWIDEDRFDIRAKPPIVNGYVTYEQNLQMMQLLLQDQFELTIHRETKKLRAYFLVVSKTGVKAPETADHSCYIVTRKTKPADIGNQRICGAMRGQIGHMEGVHLSTELLCKNLERVLGAVVFDQTNLKGHFFDISLRWMPDDDFNVHAPTATQPPLPAVGLPSLFTALKEQLGLELKSHKAPVDVLVIDHVERPSPN